jgi:hypothetical protein
MSLGPGLSTLVDYARTVCFSSAPQVYSAVDAGSTMLLQSSYHRVRILQPIQVQPARFLSLTGEAVETAVTEASLDFDTIGTVLLYSRHRASVEPQITFLKLQQRGQY